MPRHTDPPHGPAKNTAGKRSSLRSAGLEASGFHLAGATQTATQAAVECGAVLIREMRLFEEPHTLPGARIISFHLKNTRLCFGILNTILR